jgi:hypothetical protein
MEMKKFRSVMCAAIAGYCVMFGASTAHAVKTLQLDIRGGMYVDASSDPLINEQSNVAQSSSFRLYAYAAPGPVSAADILADKFRISMALLPSLLVDDADDLGSFTYQQAGSAVPTTVAVTGDMNHGTPPLETLLDNNGLPTHSVFETFYVEHEFMFDANQQSGQYDVQPTATNPDLDGPQPLDSSHNPKNMYWIAFDIDVSGLVAGHTIHFDLYNTKLVDVNNPHAGITEDVAVDMFAAFSHDAQSGGGTPPPPPPPSPPPAPGAVPEPISAVTGAMGLAVLGSLIRRRR